MSIRKPKTGSRFGFSDRDHGEHDFDDEDDESVYDDATGSSKKNKKKPSSVPRTIAFNKPLPPDLVDPETGHPIMIYPRNKIRTTKYTPLSFLPKNIFFQFSKNVANIYFLALVILGAFDIFGVPSPVLAAVPLIVIVIITAIKDAMEDSRRTVTDMEVNNQETHILKQVNFETDYVYENLNVSDEKISMWRRFKKWNTRWVVKFWGASKRNLTKEGRANKARANVPDTTDPRKSFDSMASFDADDETNNRRRMSGYHDPFHPRILKFNRSYWKDVKVGDVLRIHNNEEIPADLILLATSDPDNSCYIETKNLDGETNLKVKTALKKTSDISRADDLMNYEFDIDSEGNLKINNDQESVNINNLLLRGCTLRNTKWVIGIVAFTGDDTKIMLNAGITPTKQSRMSRELNYYVLVNFILLFIMCFVSGLVNGLYYRKRGTTSRDFFEFGTIAGSPVANGIVGFFVNLILYQSLVPISLYITIEIIKTAQAYFIYSDVGMYYEPLDFPCTPKSWSISDDLGQIEYIFSDKTGTLTQNLMEFKKCTINGKSYGRAYTEALAGLRKRMGIDVEQESAHEKELIEKDKVKMIQDLHKISKNKTYDDEITFISSEFIDDLCQDGTLQSECNHHFMLALALCHTVMTEENPKDPRKILLKAQSPDEAALVGTARSVGFNFKGSTKRGMIVDVHGETKEYQILNTLEFNSTRKRMSSIIKIPGKTPDDEPKALLICKGADSIIYERLSNTDNNPEMLENTSQHLEQYATEGLRTLCIAERQLSWSEYTEWNKRHQEAASSLDDREAKMEEVADSIERELILLGGTAIEDRLQDGVPDAISLLGEAGIKLWVLTGDKVETAINIGFSCNLLGNNMELLIIKDENVDAVISDYLMKHFNMLGSYEEKEEAMGDHSPPDDRFGVIIDGDALKRALSNAETKRKFLLLCKKCRAVLCCRVSPAQKAAVVKLVKETLDVMTLAIGDGSNDVAMIQAADVGVGIAGEEGRQAVMSSDYAIGQFRYLAKLLLTHGRWNYKRLAEMIPCFFYKNIIFTFTLFWYGIYIDFDGAYLYEFTFLMFYNLAFTSLPIIFLGIFDQDVSAKVSLLVPQLYRSGILRQDFSDAKFYYYMIEGVYQSVISFFFGYLLMYLSFQNPQGLVIDHRFWMAIPIVLISVFSANIFVMIQQYRWDWLSGLIYALSCIIVIFWIGVWSANYTSATEFYKAGSQTLGTLGVWCCFFVGVLVCLIPNFSYRVVKTLRRPTDVDIIREMAIAGDFNAYPDDYDPTDPNRPKISNYSSQVRMSMTVQTPGPPSFDGFDRSAVLSDNVPQPPTPPPGIAFSPIRKRKGFMSSMLRNSSDSGFVYQNGSNNSVVTEEIPLDDFTNQQKRVSEISDESKRRVTSM
ncbi:DNF1 Phospholipid-transporting ATPase DNF1 [Candida maltosa Xu316]